MIINKLDRLLMAFHVLKERGKGRKIPDNPKRQRSHKCILCDFEKDFYIDVDEGDCTILELPLEPRGEAGCPYILSGPCSSLTNAPHSVLLSG